MKSRLRVITLFDRPPVRIDEDRWPVIAQAYDCDDHDTPAESTREWTLKIRRRGGQYLVYGVARSVRPGEPALRRGGYLVDSLEDVGLLVVSLVERLGLSGWFPAHLGDALLADLPSEVL